MKSISQICRRSMMVIGLAAAATGIAHADEGLTRDQVKGELSAAQRNGDIVWGNEGLTLSQQFPQHYGVRAADSTVITEPSPDTNVGALSRAEVSDELARARRNGDISSGQQDLTARERYPDLYGRVNSANVGANTPTSPAE
jgi:uncharacterized protein DUF4148